MPLVDINGYGPDGRNMAALTAPQFQQFAPSNPLTYGQPMGYASPIPTNRYASNGGTIPISTRISNLVNSFDAAPAQGQSGSPYVPSMNWTGAGRPVGSVISTPKSTATQTALNTGFQQNNATNATQQQSLSDWTKQYLASKQPAQQANTQESAAIGRFYNGGAANDLAAIRQQRQTALRDLTQQAYRRAGRANSLRRIGAGGVNSSYMQRQYAQDLGGIAAQGAVQNADQARADQLYLNQQQVGNVGTREEMINRLLGRELQPAQVQSALQSDSINRLGGLAALDQGNNIYEPAENAYARRIAFMRQQMDPYAY